MQPRDYIRRKDNHKITAVVIVHLNPDQMEIQGPYNRMVVLTHEWERVPPVVSSLTNIWRYNVVSGGWELVRDTYLENAERWLEILRGDEPGVTFKAAKKRPTKAPGA